MLAGGIHFQNNWFVYKKNNNNLAPTNTIQLNASWNLSDPSPWVSANQFNYFWSQKVSVVTYKGQDILNNPSIVWNLPFYTGDAIQILSDGWFGAGDAWHTMYITSYGSYNGNMSYNLTYHSSDTKDKNLLQICQLYPNDYFSFLQ